jgi:hypothetical protein
MRKIIECVHPIRIADHTRVCAGGKGILKSALSNSKGEVLLSLAKRIHLRYAAEEVINRAGEVILKKGGLIDRNAIEKIIASDITSIRVMSPVTCRAFGDHICFRCYGDLFSPRVPAYEGLPVGIISAQSVGEPCTQLSMRVFHKGGVAEADITGGFGILVRIFEGRDEEIEFAILSQGYEDEVLFSLMLDRVQEIFLGEGVSVDDRNIEVILREVLKDGELVGMRKSASRRDGFLAKFSFENLKKNLMDSTVKWQEQEGQITTGTEDPLWGLKEKILISKRI